uniref:Uncharacterized protein n=1 Tax=Arundo donax TaxID=35708 RepID=A0A0A9DGW2_ARUDO
MLPTKPRVASTDILATLKLTVFACERIL